MSSFKNLSIKNKIITIILSIVISTIIPGFIIISKNNISLLKEEMIIKTSNQTKIIANFSSNILAENNKKNIDNILTNIITNEEITDIIILDKSGNIFASTFKSIDKTSPKAIKKHSHYIKGNYIHSHEPVIYNNEYIGEIITKTSTSILDRKINKYLLTIYIVTILIILISYILAYLSQKLISNPIVNLSKLTKAISSNKNYSCKIKSKNNDEIGLLYQEFNNLLEQIHKNETELQKSLADLSESESKYRKIIENQGEGLGTISLNEDFIYANPTAHEIFGVKKGKLEGLNIKDFVDKKHYNIILKQTEKRKKGKKTTYEIEITRPDNLKRFLRITAAPNYDKEGNIENIFAIFHDITERKIAENKLEESEKKFRDLTNLLPQSVFEIDLSGNFTYVNKIGLEIFKYTEEDINKGININVIIANEGKKRANENFMKLLNNTEFNDHEYTLITKDGNNFPGLIYSSPILINNEIKGIRGIVVDMTEQKQKEEEIKEGKENLAVTLKSIGDGVIVTNNSGIIISINPVAEKLCGWKSENAIGEKLEDVFNIYNNETNKLIKNPIDRLLNGDIDIKVSDNIELVSKTGERYKISDSAAPIKKDNGKIIGVVIVFSDFTEKHKIQEDLRAAKEKAEESDRLKTAFLTNMSHEIRTPMNAIIGFSNFLTNPEFSEKKKQGFITHIKDSGKVLLNLIDDIIDISKIESGQLKIKFEECYINKLIKELHETFSTELITHNKHDIKLIAKKDIDDENISIISDPYRLKQILTNLIHNAVKFTEKGTIEFGYNITKNNTLTFYVKDTGRGIELEYQKIVFERFRQKDISDNRIHGGAGLGLTISNNLTELLGGKMWLESTIGEGSTFYFTLPFKKGETSSNDIEENVIEDVDYNWENKTFLIVEDEKLNYFLLNDMFSYTKAKVLWAQDGIEAVKLFNSNSDIDLILMDLKLPKQDGYETTKIIRSKNKDIPIIAQTAYAMSGEYMKCFDVGCNDYIPKPIDPDKLFKMISKLL